MDVMPSPNMNMPIPVVSNDPGPDWAENINSSLLVLDGHNHSPGSGVQINPSGIDINADLLFNTNNATLLRSSRYVSQGSPLALATDLGCVYVSAGELYYNDSSGNQVQITNGGSIVGTAGSISGLPSGTASASYSGGTFVFQSATSTPANIQGGSILIGNVVASSNFTTLSAFTGLAANYTLVLPSALPGASSAFMVSDTSGNMSYVNVDNSTLQVSGTTIQIKASGVGTSQLANGSVGTSQLANGAVTRPKQASVGQQISASCGTFSTSAGPVDVTNLSVTITTSGRPVMVIIQGDTTGASPDVFAAANSGASASLQTFMSLVRGSTVLWEYPFTIVFPSGSTANLGTWGLGQVFLDPVSAGTYTYKVQLTCGTASGSAGMRNAVIMAFEL